MNASRRKQMFKLLGELVLDEDRESVIIKNPHTSDRAYISQFGNKTSYRFRTKTCLNEEGEVCLVIVKPSAVLEKGYGGSRDLEVVHDEELVAKALASRRVEVHKEKVQPVQQHSQRHLDWQRWAEIIQEPASTRSPEDVQFLQYCREHYQPGELHRD